MSVDELSVMDGSKCILQLRDVRPFFSNKYNIIVKELENTQIKRHQKLENLEEFFSNDA